MMNETYYGHMLRQKVMDMENKVKDKTYYVKGKVKTLIYQSKYRLHHHKKGNMIDHCISIAAAMFIIAFSLFTAINWLFWLGVISILSNCILLTVTLSKNGGRKG